MHASPPPRVIERQVFKAMSQLSWLLTLAAFAAVVAALAGSRLAFEAEAIPMNVLVFVVFGTVAVVYTYWRDEPVIAAATDAVALLSAFTLAGAVLTYATTVLGAGRPLWDARFMAADRALGFDWLGWLAWLNARPSLARLLDECYLSILKQVPVLILVLAALRRADRLQTFLLACQVSLIACALGGWLTPALGIYAHLGIEPGLHHPDIPLATRDSHLAEVLQLRGAAPVVSLTRIEGIIVFPSFHMAAAILLAWGFWAVPYLRWPMLGVNAGMIAATPFSGGHYLVDLIAGGVLALASLFLAKRTRSALERRASAELAVSEPLAAPA